MKITHMYITLEENVKKMLCCPLCKGELKEKKNSYLCHQCAGIYPLKTVGGASQEKIFDFRIHVPAHSLAQDEKEWMQIQSEYERRYATDKEENLHYYSKEAIHYNEIYQREFKLRGAILDVGGGDGKLRQYFSHNPSLYVVADPFIEVFKTLKQDSKLLASYPVLREPLNFVAARAEYLPFYSGVFDWVNIRSALDHVRDPYLTMKEAYRVLKPGGKVLFGGVVYGNKSVYDQEQLTSKTKSLIGRSLYLIRSRGLSYFIKRAFKKFNFGKPHLSHHTFSFKYNDVVDLLEKTHFTIKREYWPKAPFNMCVFLEAEKVKFH